MQTGKIISIVGAIVDVEFPAGATPKIYDALKVSSANLVLETQQQLGDSIVRTIAMGST
ncbi:MAG TPA: F0F1 ATP synthase subunit beta, partial [Coxiellaceae bacterium]|nr:F0F1 ATP synthase subunit beta [Coxiellaceae bacterium]